MQQIGDLRSLPFLVLSSLTGPFFEAAPLVLLIFPLLAPPSSISLFFEFATGGTTFLTAGIAGSALEFSCFWACSAAFLAMGFVSSSSKALVLGKFTSISSQLLASHSSSSSSSSSSGFGSSIS
uniref:Eukaryotic translation initiation factor 2 family protein / eIF-2 family protein n=1 Tax=Arundo donax TaxID=35708 RepID=A0A0A9E3Y8_ARUDO